MLLYFKYVNTKHLNTKPENILRRILLNLRVPTINKSEVFVPLLHDREHAPTTKDT